MSSWEMRHESCNLVNLRLGGGLGYVGRMTGGES